MACYASGWSLVVLVTAVTAAMVGGILAVHGTGQEGLSWSLRMTGRTAFLCFVAAFVARPLHELMPTPLSGWMVENRRYLGVSFAVPHLTVHVPLIAWLFSQTTEPDPPVPAFVVVFGGLGLLLVGAMLATSFDGAAVRLGPRRWRALHKAGLYYVMSVFAFDFLEGVVAEEKLLHAPFAALLVAAIGVRVAAASKRKSRTSPSASGASTRGENGERGGEATAWERRMMDGSGPAGADVREKPSDRPCRSRKGAG